MLTPLRADQEEESLVPVSSHNVSPSDGKEKRGRKWLADFQTNTIRLSEHHILYSQNTTLQELFCLLPQK